MQLPKSVQQHLRKEYRFAADKVVEADRLRDKLYFFSALFGEANRALNQHWDAELALIHNVLQEAHKQINARVLSVLSRSEPVVSIPPELPGAIDKVAQELADIFEMKEVDSTKLYEVLVRVAELSYVTSGNGYYLYLKGDLKV